jgi:hypothetical protein
VIDLHGEHHSVLVEVDDLGRGQRLNSNWRRFPAVWVYVAEDSLAVLIGAQAGCRTQEFDRLNLS